MNWTVLNSTWQPHYFPSIGAFFLYVLFTLAIEGILWGMTLLPQRKEPWKASEVALCVIVINCVSAMLGFITAYFTGGFQ